MSKITVDQINTTGINYFDKDGTIISPLIPGDSINVQSGCIGNTDLVSGYSSRFVSYVNEARSIQNTFLYDYVTTGGDSYQSFTAVDNNYFSKMLILSESSPLTQTISVYNGAGTGGTLIASWSQDLNLDTITVPAPIKLTLGQQYTVRLQGPAFSIYTDGGGSYGGGSFNGTGESLYFDIYTNTSIESFNINNTTGSVLARIASIPNLSVANGIVQTDGSGNVSSSITLPSTTLATTQTYGTNNTTLSTTAFVQAAVAAGQFWEASAEVLSPTDVYNINFESCGLGNTDSSVGYNFNFRSAAQVLSVSWTVGAASDNDAGNMFFSFTPVDSNFLTTFQIRIIGTSSKTFTIIKDEGIGGTVLWTSSVLALVNGWNTIIVTSPVPLDKGRKYTIRAVGSVASWYGEYPKTYPGGISNVLVFPHFQIYTTAISANFIVNRTTGYFGFGGTSDPTEMVDVTGNIQASGSVKTNTLTEKTASNGVVVPTGIALKQQTYTAPSSDVEYATKKYVDGKAAPSSASNFMAIKNANQSSVTGDGTFVLVTYGDEQVDVGSEFDGTYYTASTARIVSFEVGCTFDIAAGTNTWFVVNLMRFNSSLVIQETVPVAYGLVADNLDAVGDVNVLGRSASIKMNATDKVAVRVAVSGNGTPNVSINSYNYQRFSGFMTALL
jgi:hypothetical protein